MQCSLTSTLISNYHLEYLDIFLRFKTFTFYRLVTINWSEKEKERDEILPVICILLSVRFACPVGRTNQIYDCPLIWNVHCREQSIPNRILTFSFVLLCLAKNAEATFHLN